MRDPAVAAAMAVFDKSASRTVANAQTAAWAVLRDYIDKLETASTPPGDACVRHACKRVRMEMQARIDALAEGIVWPSGVLNKADTLAILTQHNAWRRGAKTEQTDPCMVGLALDAAIAAIKGDSHAG